MLPRVMIVGAALAAVALIVASVSSGSPPDSTSTPAPSPEAATPDYTVLGRAIATSETAFGPRSHNVLTIWLRGAEREITVTPRCARTPVGTVLPRECR